MTSKQLYTAARGAGCQQRPRFALQLLLDKVYIHVLTADNCQVCAHTMAVHNQPHAILYSTHVCSVSSKPRMQDHSMWWHCNRTIMRADSWPTSGPNDRQQQENVCSTCCGSYHLRWFPAPHVTILSQNSKLPPSPIKLQF